MFSKAPEGWRSPKPGGNISRRILGWLSCSCIKNTNQTSQLMKKSIVLAASLLALTLTPVIGQQPSTPPAPVLPPSSPRLYAPPSAPQPSNQEPFHERLQQIINRANSDQNQPPALTKFNLDFPGGTPKELVAAIEKAMGKPLNAIIPDESEETKIPALKMSNVDVPHLFNAVVNMSYKYAPRDFGGGGGFGGQPRDVVSSYGFETRDGDMSDDSIWYFFVYKAPTQQAPPPPQKICQFYSLSPYLDRGFTVDDITTAIQTGWKMAGVTPTPELNYHKETKLLIAFGEPDKLKTIQNVLQTLPTSNATRNELDKLEKGMDKLTDIVGTLQGEVARHDIKLNQIPMSAPSTSKTPEEKSGK